MEMKPQGLGLPAGQVVKLVDLIPWPEGSMAASILVDMPNGSCRTVALDQGQGRGEHTTPFEALVYILDGEAEITILGQPHRLKPGEMIRIPADEPHSLKAVTKLKLMSVKIKP